MTLLRRMLDVTFIFAEKLLVWCEGWFRGKGEGRLLVLCTRTSRYARTTLLTLPPGGMVEAADGWGFDEKN